LRKTLLFFSLILLQAALLSQQDSNRIINKTDSINVFPLLPDSLVSKVTENPYYIDSLNLIVKDVVVSGNEITKDEIILREMLLKKGKKFTFAKYEHDVQRIYNLGLFTKVDILPIPAGGKDIVLNVDVQERWYILPLPTGGMEDGEWKKIWVGINSKWENFRGRNETLGLNFRIFYNPSINLSYSVPWIGEKLHLFSSYEIGYSRTRNKSLQAVGKPSGSETISASDYNYDNFRFHTLLRLGKYVTDRLNFYTDFGYDYLRVSVYSRGRTLSTTGKDKYFVMGIGSKYDSRNIIEFATKGYYLNTSYTRYGLIDNVIDFGRFSLESQSFIPVNITPNYFITLASRFYTSLTVGSVIPYYNHSYLGYSEDYVAGWKGVAFEGEDALTFYNEIRIPVFQPRYINAEKIPIVGKLPILKKLDLKHGLFFTVFYDVGAVFDKGTKVTDVKFLSGTGIGLNFILPFGYVVRTEWGFRIAKPIVGQFGLSLSAKF
jgi:outer membrane protein assembly factor BamA